MSFFNRLTAVLLAAALVAPMAPLEAKTRKGDRFYAQGRIHEEKKEWDAALEDFEKALSEDPADLAYQMAAQKARFQTAQSHIDKGLDLRDKGQLGEALLEFQKAYGISPGSAAAQQELARTQDMIERERRRVEATGQEAPPAERALTPIEEMRQQQEKKIERMLPIPELRPLNPQKIDLKMNNQKAKVIFDTLGKVAGINVLWDPDYQPPPRDGFTIDFADSTVEQALDYAAILTKSFWKVLSANTIFITNDNPNKRRDYEEQVTKIFYLRNVSAAQEIQEIVNAVRGAADLQRVFPINSQNAILVRAEADRVALAGKLINDLDKPRSEVVVDIMVIEASSIFKRDITTAIASGGLTMPVTFAPRSSISTTSSSTDSGGATTTTTALPLTNVRMVDGRDFSTTLPSALLQATLNDARSKVLQAPQVRSIDNVKATLKIGDREPTATGSFQPGIGGVGINPLVNTQFTYIDVGVNVDLTPHVHDNGDVSMHVDIEISAVNGTVDLGGIKQPIIGQRKITHDIRMHEGEVGLLGGLIKSQDSSTVTGIPGLNRIPVLRRLFSGESVDREGSELMIALIPHIIRRQEITPENLREVAVGNQTTIHLNYAPEQLPPSALQVQPGTLAAPPATAAPAPAAVPSQSPVAPPATAPPATAPPASAPPATAPPATAPPATAPPATAPPATAPPATAPGPPASNARIAFSLPSMNVLSSTEFAVNLMVENGADVSSAPFEIQFDPKLLRLTDVVPGDYFARSGAPPSFTKNIQNDTGTASIQIGRSPGEAPAAGSGTLVTLRFQAIGTGSTPVSVPNISLRNPQGQVVGSASPQVVVNVK